MRVAYGQEIVSSLLPDLNRTMVGTGPAYGDALNFSACSMSLFL